jgi:alkanesulfonate monooxygenase SsuD/methylene tetrahydromethanopterin reductase-like flavin-dependent oxidoreductase (luciferase family)
MAATNTFEKTDSTIGRLPHAPVCDSVPMQVGMTMPVMEPDLDAHTLETWARGIDDGPFSALCFGERMAFDNPETLTLLGAVAAWTKRVRLVTTVVVPQLHEPVLLAKALATGDLLSEGRLTVGLGVGGREEDYRAVGADPATQTMAEMAERIATMKRIWAGENLTGSVRPVGPAPVQPGGPELLVGTLGPKTIRSAAHWADGLAGISLDLMWRRWLGSSTSPALPGQRQPGRRRASPRRCGSPSATAPATARPGNSCTSTCVTT